MISIADIQSQMSTPPVPLARVPSKTMGQTEFLSLLVTQMRNQDPLKPVSDTEFIAQMAQFTSLEQTKAMSSDVQELRQSYALTQGTNLLGKTVKVATSENENQVFTKGIVTGLEVNRDGDVSLILNNKAYALESVIAVNSEIPQN
jgi:flagellar basal-body rod modification protein FlgD